MKQLHSAITTFQKEQPSQTGMPVGERGLATQENSRVAEWLGNRSPAEVDKAAVLRASQLGVRLSVSFDYSFPRDERGNSLPTVVRVKSCEVGGTEEARAEALSAIRKLEAQAETRSIEAWLAELSVITARRQDDEFSEALRLEAYASRLRAYPADVAREAVLNGGWKFWPSWSELEARCNTLAAPRRAMIRALECGTPSERMEQRERVTAARAAEIIKEVFGENE